ncbi:response regulator [uncultured Aquimarina sp.]|uniref:response regulator n=1 Tax=uncultured Aquimarina sp. TaxID=575652 RepID=UPI00261C775F|nr:response regulator [uncultured Aquimarina sp.]
MKKIAGLDCIILVDDDKITNYIHQRVIKRSDIDVSIKINKTGSEALSYLKNMSNYPNDVYPKPGIIFLDINMPGMNGWDFINEYRKLPDEQKRRIIIAMLTTSTNPDDEYAAKQTPEINMFLKKPLTAEKLETTINSYFPIV